MTERVKFFTGSTLNLLILLVVAVQAYIYRGQWKVMQGQGAIMKRQVENAAVSERAYLGLKGVGIDDPILNNTIVVNASFVNGGRTPAWNVETKFRTRLVEGPPPPFDWNAPATQLSDAGLTLTFFPAGAEKRVTFPKILGITKQHFGEFEKGVRNIYVDGEVRFSDQMGNRQIFSFGMICAFRDNGRFRERYQGQRDANPT